MPDKNDYIKMFLAGVDWERKRVNKPAIRVAINNAMGQIRVAEQRNDAETGIRKAPVDRERSKCANCGNTITFHVYNNAGWRHEEGIEPPMTPSMEICGKPEPHS